jgi:hypothetical protein
MYKLTSECETVVSVLFLLVHSQRRVLFEDVVSVLEVVVALVVVALVVGLEVEIVILLVVVVQVHQLLFFLLVEVVMVLGNLDQVWFLFLVDVVMVFGDFDYFCVVDGLYFGGDVDSVANTGKLVFIRQRRNRLNFFL